MWCHLTCSVLREPNIQKGAPVLFLKGPNPDPDLFKKERNKIPMIGMSSNYPIWLCNFPWGGWQPLPGWEKILSISFIFFSNFMLFNTKPREMQASGNCFQQFRGFVPILLFVYSMILCVAGVYLGIAMARAAVPAFR
jgi:hypothetical protein|mmetsp:Transcript_64507/g.106814  ORF Transcript_64507/g.106814 Transcript_64507/m.106814 type:complete len:138 (+) Transcript_64507:880-1293(+)